MELDRMFEIIYKLYIIKVAFSNLTIINIVNNIIQKFMEGLIINGLNVVVPCLNVIYNKYRFDMIDKRFDIIERDVAELKSDVSELKTDVAELKTDVSELKSDVAGLKSKTTNIEKMLELLLEKHNIISKD